MMRIAGAALLVMLLAAAAQPEQDDDAPGTAATPPAAAAPVAVDAGAASRGGIVAAPLRAITAPRRERAFGTVLDPAALAQSVETWTAARGEAQAAEAKRDASRAAFERAQRLYGADRNVSQAELQSAEATFRADAAAADSAAARQRSLEVAMRADWGPVVAAAIAAHEPLVDRVLSGRVVLVRVALSAAAAGRGRAVADGTGAVLTRLSEAGRADPRVPGVPVLFVAEAAPGLLSGANLAVETESDETVSGLLVPESAVVRWQGGDWIYVVTAPGAYARRAVATDMPVAGGYLATGLPSGTQAAVRGAQLLLSQEFKGNAGDSD